MALQELLVGAAIDVDLSEVGIAGLAEIVAVRPCPPIEPDDGLGRRLITAVFRHKAGNVLDLHLSDGQPAIGTTGNHLFWSEDRQVFLAADDLRLGERLRLADRSTTTVASLVPREESAPVYNLEIDGQHVYHVGENGVLVHNTYPAKTGPKTDNRFGHNRMIRKTAREVTAKGDTVIAGGRAFDGVKRKESVIKIKNGIKTSRTADGKQPVLRERQALQDLEKRIEMYFVRYGSAR